MDCRVEAVKVAVGVGDDGTPIGRVADGDNTGMVVLFGEEKPEPGTIVFCTSYDVRTSRKGKNYVKCFKWVKTEEEVEEEKRRCRERRLKRLEEAAKLVLPPDLEEFAGDFVNGRMPEEAMEKIILYAYRRVGVRDPGFIVVTVDHRVYEFGSEVYSDDDVRYVHPDYQLRSGRVFGRIPGSMVVRGWVLIPRKYERLVKAIEEVDSLLIKEETTSAVVDKILWYALRDKVPRPVE